MGGRVKALLRHMTTARAACSEATAAWAATAIGAQHARASASLMGAPKARRSHRGEAVGDAPKNDVEAVQARHRAGAGGYEELERPAHSVVAVWGGGAWVHAGESQRAQPCRRGSWRWCFGA